MWRGTVWGEGEECSLGSRLHSTSMQWIQHMCSNAFGCIVVGLSKLTLLPGCQLTFICVGRTIVC